jgi:hypothetical protein
MVHKLKLAAISIDYLTGISESMTEDAFSSEKAEKLIDVGRMVDANRKFDMAAMTRTAITLTEVACGATI